MKCPSCVNGILVDSYLEKSFSCKTCESCEGHWILLEDFLQWREQDGQENIEAVDIAFELSETTRAMVCPVSGKLMLKFKISNETSHKLDLSPSVNGIWLDKGEWEYLKQAGLAGRINSIFTEPWQRQIRKEKAYQVFDDMYREQFGEDDYSKLKELREWLNNHPRKKLLYAFLNANNPWSAFE